MADGKKILVTGGAGFIGSHLCRFLLDQGSRVVCLDNFSSGKKENVKELLNNKNFELIDHDITNPVDLKVDEIYNLACLASPYYYQKYPIETLKTSVQGALNVLELSRKLGGIKVLQASTSEVYGDPQIHPQVESYNGNVDPIGPRACYDEGKRCAETLFFDYYRQYDVPIKIVRIFNTYGPNMAEDDGRVISNFITQALSGKKLTVHGAGDQTRSFCYVSDMVEGIYKMMQTDNFTGPVNLGNERELTIKEIAEKIAEKLGAELQLNARPQEDREGDPKRRQPDISLAREKLNWQPVVELEEGLEKTINYFKIAS